MVKHWRGKGLRIFTFLDDGAAAESSLDLARDMSTIVQQDIAQSGFVAHTEKCQWKPTQSGELLGFIMDLRSGNLRSGSTEVGGGYAVQIGDLSATGCWSEADRKRSSTWREIRGTKLVLQPLVGSLKGKEVLHRTDNRNTVRILSVGSRKQDLHQDAIDIYKLCQGNNIRFFGLV